ALKTKSPSTAERCDSPASEGKQAMPSARRPTPTQRASGMPMPSGFPPKTNPHGTSGIAMKMTPTTISIHADTMTTYRCIIIFFLRFFSNSHWPWNPGAAAWVNPTIKRGRPSLWEHEYKIDRLLLAHKHHTQIHPRSDQANFVADPFGDQRG